LLFTAVTFMRAMQALFSGPLAESCSGFPDLVRGEKFVIAPVTLLMFAIGISPQFIFNIFNATVAQMARLFACNAMIAWTIYITFAGAIVLLVLPRVFSRWIALVTTTAGFAISLATFFCDDVDLAHFTTIVRVAWVPALGMNYHLALDGISLTLVLVTGIVAISAVLFSWDVTDRANEFFFWLLLVVGGAYGVFLSVDLFLLFLFYELVIVPKYFLIAIFGSTDKEYGAMKLTLYSFFCGALVFLGIIAAYVSGGSLDLTELAQFQFAPQLQSWAFPVLFLGFAVLAGIWPLHTWAPTGHVAAPTAGSMLLAGIVMKLGAYASLRVAMNLFPQGFQ